MFDSCLTIVFDHSSLFALLGAIQSPRAHVTLVIWAFWARLVMQDGHTYIKLFLF